MLIDFLNEHWHASGVYIYRSSDPRDQRQIARVPTVAPPNHEPHPIARFIAAEPDLLRACKAALKPIDYDCSNQEQTDLRDLLRAAIREAIGPNV